MLRAVFIAATLAWPAGADGSLGQPDPEFHVRITRPALAGAVHDALGGASRRLRRPYCSAIFGDFSDASGRTLQSNLDALGRTGPAYLGLIRFHDGQGVQRCERAGIMAVTSPGSRVVWVCGGCSPWRRSATAAWPRWRSCTRPCTRWACTRIRRRAGRSPDAS